MKKTALSLIVVIMAIIGTLFMKSQDLIGANVNKAYSTVAPYRQYFCSDCTEYEVLTFNDEDNCSTGWIGK